MKKLIKKLLREQLFNEIKYDSSNISEDIGLFIIRKNTLMLYDMLEYDDSERIRGVKGIITLSDENGKYSVNKVAAVKGYGPIMYELAMQHIYPNPLISDRDGDTREGALGILQKFSQGINKEVEVTTLQPNDLEYVECLEFGCDDNEPEFFKLHNSEFKMSNKSLYNKLKYEGEEFLEDVGFEFIDELEGLGSDFFDKMYMS
tara:strand:+ start:10441 stop:11049 length:609 start_codon:yes stop_codon:yes gene_type:complete